MVGTVRQNALNHVVMINERLLKRLLREYVEHYNQTPPHRTVGCML
ncbi:MAG: hypothetical protein GTO63_27440 [Anaerolineae bacterium]|nr:hypothetical protein [Anaerolineae bacterium]NIN98464.1 hypothetical protein [Anaerolineae bacterium]NIQ81361.1 hypothetical protein [Anaerolineae bacterium]